MGGNDKIRPGEDEVAWRDGPQGGPLVAGVMGRARRTWGLQH